MQRYLVIQLARFGDLVQTRRLIASLQAGRADMLVSAPSEVHLLVDESLVEPATLVYPGAIIHSLKARGFPASASADVRSREEAILLTARDALDELSGLDFTQVYNLNYSGMNFALSALFPADRVRGYRQENGQPRRDPWSSLCLRLVRDRRISTLNLVDLWSGYLADSLPGVEVNPVAVPHGGGVGVAVAGRHVRRSLPPDVLAPAIMAVVERLGRGPITLLGSGQEKAAAAALKKHLRPKFLDMTTDLTGRTGWRDLAEVVSGLDVLLTPDTGTMHLAAYLGTPVEAFFLSSASCHETGPYGAGHRVWQATRACAPCAETEECPYGVACLEPFRDRAFLRRISSRGGKSGDLPEGLTLFGTDFDDLGVVCRPLDGRDAWAAGRSVMRELLRERLGLPMAQGMLWAGQEAAIDNFFREADWMTGVPCGDAARSLEK